MTATSMASPGQSTSDTKMSSSSRVMRNMAEKMRRDKLNNYVTELASLVPLVADSNKKYDKTSILRLAASYIRLHSLLKSDEDSTTEQASPSSSSSSSSSSSKSVFLGIGDVAQNMLEAIGGFLLVVTSSGKVVFVSSTIERFFGHCQAEIMGSNVYNIIHPDDHSILQQQLNAKGSARRSFFCRMMEKSLSRNDPGRYEIIHIVGQIRPFSSSSSFPPSPASSVNSEMSDDDDRESVDSVVSSSGSLGSHMMVCFIRIIKDRPITELSLLESTQDEYITRHFIDGRILYSDHRMSTVLGMMPEEVQGKPAFMFMLEDDVLWSIVAQKQMFGSSQGQGTVMTRLMTQNGETVNVRSRGYLEVDKVTGKVDTFVCINSVVSREEAEEEMKNQRRKLFPVVSNPDTQVMIDNLINSLGQDERNLLQKLIGHKLLNSLTQTPNKKSRLPPKIIPAGCSSSSLTSQRHPHAPIPSTSSSVETVTPDVSLDLPTVLPTVEESASLYHQSPHLHMGVSSSFESSCPKASSLNVPVQIPSNKEWNIESRPEASSDISSKRDWNSIKEGQSSRSPDLWGGSSSNNSSNSGSSSNKGTRNISEYPMNVPVEASQQFGSPSVKRALTQEEYSMSKKMTITDLRDNSRIPDSANTTYYPPQHQSPRDSWSFPGPSTPSFDCTPRHYSNNKNTSELLPSSPLLFLPSQSSPGTSPSYVLPNGQPLQKSPESQTLPEHSLVHYTDVYNTQSVNSGNSKTLSPNPNMCKMSQVSPDPTEGNGLINKKYLDQTSMEWQQQPQQPQQQQQHQHQHQHQQQRQLSPSFTRTDHNKIQQACQDMFLPEQPQPQQLPETQLHMQQSQRQQQMPQFHQQSQSQKFPSPRPQHQQAQMAYQQPQAPIPPYQQQPHNDMYLLQKQPQLQMHHQYQQQVQHCPQQQNLQIPHSHQQEPVVQQIQTQQSKQYTENEELCLQQQELQCGPHRYQDSKCAKGVDTSLQSFSSPSYSAPPPECSPLSLENPYNLNLLPPDYESTQSHQDHPGTNFNRKSPETCRRIQEMRRAQSCDTESRLQESMRQDQQEDHNQPNQPYS
ncbi:uncharacterized protein LOC143022628 isoform X2 [Oratosquilla oratoria]|uniref:uncharacterized protein LOC143022628 isoform X2 n=1 Tax=Oratosquilla oratoria TaxID=337810 RepID=UPI003F76D848